MLVRTGTWLVALTALSACSRGASNRSAATEEIETASLVAALAADTAGDDANDATAAGAEPFFVAGCDASDIVDQVVDRLDADGDGTLGEEELAVLGNALGGRRERHLLLLRLYDADDSGSIDAAEIAAFEADLTARCESRKARLLERFDANGDGTLDADEQQAAEDALRARFEARHRRGGDAGADADGGAFERGRRPGFDLGRRRADAERRFDRDGDGRLDPREDASLREHLRGCVRGDHALEPAGADQPGTPPAAAADDANATTE